MYESIIKVIVGSVETSLVDEVYKVVQNYGVDVNKEELIRALRYDREQYEKGYADGRAEAVVRGHWEKDTGSWMRGRCSVCKREYLWDNIETFCPNCGACNGGELNENKTSESL